MQEEQDANGARPGLALRIGIAGALGIGAVVSGLVVSRRGRRLVREAWQGRRRTRLEDRVLDVFWGDPVLGRRDLEVTELEPGVIAVSGGVAAAVEGRRAVRLAGEVRDVRDVEDRIEVDSRLRLPRRLQV